MPLGMSGSFGGLPYSVPPTRLCAHTDYHPFRRGVMRTADRDEPCAVSAPCRGPARLLAERLPACPALPMGPWINQHGVRSSYPWLPVTEILLSCTSIDPPSRCQTADRTAGRPDAPTGARIKDCTHPDSKRARPALSSNMIWTPPSRPTAPNAPPSPSAARSSAASTGAPTLARHATKQNCSRHREGRSSSSPLLS